MQELGTVSISTHSIVVGRADVRYNMPDRVRNSVAMLCLFFLLLSFFCCKKKTKKKHNVSFVLVFLWFCGFFLFVFGWLVCLVCPWFVF